VATAESPELTPDEYFSAEAEFWRAIYTAGDVYGVIHQDRKSLVLAWVDELALPAGATALEVGCGAGLTAVELADRGLRVEATDAVQAMVDLARRHAAWAGLSDAVRVTRADAHQLTFDDGSFDLVLAMGVIPWLASPDVALREMARVLKPGGALLVNCDNAARLDHLVDPAWNRGLAGLRKLVAKLVPGSWLPAAGLPVGRHSIAEFDSLLSTAGLEKEKGTTFGFGPFTLFDRTLVPRRLEVPLHYRLQRRADRGSRLLGGRGAQYLVAARRW
jgi:2-polyprenyl-3-methyl-5-hydroxy-6-metoxy-1,4-benzoquinol methylase